MAYVRLCDVNYIFANTIIDGNLDASFINKFIDGAQRKNIQGIIGEYLYNKITNDLFNNVLIDPYLSLVENYIQICLAQYTVYNAFPFINWHLTNKGVSTKSSEFSQPAEMEAIVYLRQEILSDAQFLAEQIKHQIVNNPQLYPEYYMSQGINPILPANDNYSSGMYFNNGSGNISTSMKNNGIGG